MNMENINKNLKEKDKEIKIKLYEKKALFYILDHLKNNIIALLSEKLWINKGESFMQNMGKEYQKKIIRLIEEGQDNFNEDEKIILAEIKNEVAKNNFSSLEEARALYDFLENWRGKIHIN